MDCAIAADPVFFRRPILPFPVCSLCRRIVSTIIGRTGCIGKRTLSEDAPATAREAAPVPAETREDRVTRARAVGNLISDLDGYRRLTCECGVGIKIPPGSTWTSIPCPRCGRDNEVPRT